MSGLRSSRNLSAAHTLIRAGNLTPPRRFWTLGVKPDPMVPHTWGLGHPRGFPRGGRCWNIYKDVFMYTSNSKYLLKANPPYTTLIGTKAQLMSSSSFTFSIFFPSGVLLLPVHLKSCLMHSGPNFHFTTLIKGIYAYVTAGYWCPLSYDFLGPDIYFHLTGQSHLFVIYGSNVDSKEFG